MLRTIIFCSSGSHSTYSYLVTILHLEELEVEVYSIVLIVYTQVKMTSRKVSRIYLLLQVICTFFQLLLPLRLFLFTLLS